MLNISENSITGQVKTDAYECFESNKLPKSHRSFSRWIFSFILVFVLLLFLPWTQNIQSKGKTTTLRPEHRPQTIHSTIPGRIEKWFVQEGALVKAGDTIVYLSEVKDEYFDSGLLDRTASQVQSKGDAIEAYGNKMSALERQILALREGYLQKKAQTENKLQQVRLKQISSEAALEQAKLDESIALLQFNRVDSLFKLGLKSRTDMELKQLKLQETKAKLVESENKFQEAQNEVSIIKLELSNLENEYGEKIAKAESDLFSTASLLHEGEVQKLKLEVSLENYKTRNSFYYILAPQDCYITKAITPGIGETVKAGDPIVTVMPSDFELAVEMYVHPMDFPLVAKEQEVRFIFDGWPAFIFAGWPQISTGIFAGEIVAVDNTISENGKYRILAAPKTSGKPWPSELRPGAGVQSIALLNSVPVWYEIWRRLNGFPPDYYEDAAVDLPKLKVPLKSVPK